MTPESVNEQQLRVDSVIEDTYRLAQHLGNDFEGIGPLKDTFAHQPSLFCYAAFGEQGAGKTTLLEKIVGSSWETGEDATVQGCALWCYTPASARWKKTQPGGIIERYANIEFFKTCSVLDSGPSDDALVMEQARSATSQSDVIFLLFSADNPYCPETWKLADGFATNGYRNVILVLTKFAGSSIDAHPVLERLREIAEQRWRYKAPAIALILSEAEAERSVQLLHKTVSSLPSVSLNRRDLLKGKLSVTYELIQELRAVITAQDMAMRQDGGFLQSLEREIDRMREEESKKVSARLESMASIGEEFLPEVIDAAADKLGYYPSILKLFSYKNLPIKIDEWFFMVLEKAMEARLESYDLEFIEQCRTHWESVRPRAQKQLHCEIGDFPETELARELARYRQQVRRSLFKPLADLKLRIYLGEEFLKRESWIRVLVTICLGLLTLGSILGIVGIYDLTVILWGMAFALWMCGVFALGISRKNMRESGYELVEPFGEIIRANLKRPLEEAALCSVAGYRSSLSAIHSRISLSREALAPIQEQLSEVYKNCYALNNTIR